MVPGVSAAWHCGTPTGTALGGRGRGTRGGRGWRRGLGVWRPRAVCKTTISEGCSRAGSDPSRRHVDTPPEAAASGGPPRPPLLPRHEWVVASGDASPRLVPHDEPLPADRGERALPLRHKPVPRPPCLPERGFSDRPPRLSPVLLSRLPERVPPPARPQKVVDPRVSPRRRATVAAPSEPHLSALPTP